MSEDTHILLVDDDPHLLRATSRLLKKAGYGVTEAETGAEGLRMATERKPDLILLDVDLPDMDGLEVCQRIKGEPSLAQSFVILMSNVEVQPDDRADGPETGADGYIARPIANRELLAWVKAFLRIKRAEADIVRAEGALQESEKQLRLAMDAAEHGFWDWNLDTNETYFSPNYYKLLGYEPGELPMEYETWEKLLHPQDRDSVVPVVEEAVAKGEPFDIEFRMQTKSGDWKWIWGRGKAYETDKEGVPHRVVGTHSDITQRKQAEQIQQQSLREMTALNALGRQISSDLRLDQVIRSALEGIFDLTEADLALLFLRSADKLFIRGEKHRQPRFQHEDTPVHSVGECLCGLAVSERRALYSRNIHKDPRCTWEECRRAGLVSFAALPLHSGDEVTGVLGLASATERDFGQQAAFLEAASNQIAIGLQNAIFCEHLKDHATRLEQEITERKQAEERIHQQEERLRRVVENMPVMMDALDENDAVIAWNRECERVTGYSAAEMVRNPRAMEKLYPDPEYLEQVIAEASDLGFDFRGKEWTLICKDGTEKTICWSNISARFPIPGWHTWAIGVDVTERVRAEEERESLLTQIREQARQLQQVLVTVPTGVLLLDAEGRIVQANPAAEKDLTSLADTRVGDVLTHLGDRSLNELLTSPPTKGLWHEIKVNGRIFEVIARPVENGPRSEHWVLVINDATQEREIQAQLQQQERLATVGQLAAGIAHDFNNIMAAITLYAHMAAQSQALSKRHREGMAVIDQQARHAVRLIEQILDFSRRAVLERRPLDFLPLLKEQVKLLERTLPEHIEIALNYGHDEYTVHADPTRMKQMLTNLAVNARDAMPDGGILRIELERVTVEPGQSSIMPEMEVGAWIRLTVSDTGTGIPPDVLPHIFEPFFTTKGPGEGSGLGLAQVHGIVGQHGGRTDVETQVDEGTTFTIYLPALDVRPVELPLPDVSAKPRGQGQVVLVVEDAGRVRGALAASLEQWNYQVLEAANGKEALAVLGQRGEQVDLVLSDVVMPGMGGMALFHALRERGWETPMILLTGHPMEKELEDLRAQGLTAWLPKPPSIERLAQAVADALET